MPLLIIVENVFHLQVIGEGNSSQLNLTWRNLEEKRNVTNICKNCDTFELNERINRSLFKGK